MGRLNGRLNRAMRCVPGQRTFCPHTEHVFLRHGKDPEPPYPTCEECNMPVGTFIVVWEVLVGSREECLAFDEWEKTEGPRGVPWEVFRAEWFRQRGLDIDEGEG